MSSTTLETPSLAARWEALKAAEPHLKIRDAAARLHSSEAGLLSLLLGKGVVRLRCEPAGIFPRLEAFGSLMALTRNDGAVHERHGVYSNVQIQGNVGLLANPDIDLRLDFSVWSQAFAETKQHAGRTLRSLQFFDARGVALHKVYLETDAHAEAWNALVAEFNHPDQSPVEAEAAPETKAPEAELDEEARRSLVAAWEGLRDPHYFHGLLRRHKASRRQAFAAAEGRFARRVQPDALKELLAQASVQTLPLMVFVGNPGSVQIHTGTVSRILPLGTWINVMDPEFNLHVDLARVAEAWVVTKPSPDGLVTSVEFLSPDGDLVVQFFGKRKPGTPELAAWTALVAAL